MNNQSNEFQKIKEDTTSLEIVRRAFRVPIEGVENIFLVIRGTKYKIVDIAQGGIGIWREDNSIFAIDEIIRNCELHIFDHIFKNLKVGIIHFSPEEPKSLHCGIQWIDIDRQSSDKLSEIILTMKNQLLKQDKHN
ncbi:MAG: PilZ domain-containing protein [Thermodesulfobacteriota bacterium]